MNFIATKPQSFTWNQVHKVGSNMRKGLHYNEDILEAYLQHHVHLTMAVMDVCDTAMNSLLTPYSTQRDSV